tara:strand:+ start:5320 stop:5529 length:210 start_codon:yes stop_codon:yes gene_type:complete
MSGADAARLGAGLLHGRFAPRPAAHPLCEAPTPSALLLLPLLLPPTWPSTAPRTRGRPSGSSTPPFSTS